MMGYKSNDLDYNEVKVKNLKREYDKDFHPSDDYLDGMPDLQNSDFKDISIEFVGIQGFKLPIKLRTRDGGTQDTVATISGSVSLDAEHRGINMSRIIRTAYANKAEVFTIDSLERVLKAYKKDLDTFDAHIMMNFQYHLWQDALRSKDDKGEAEGGWQFYNITFDVNMDKNDEFKKIMWVDFVYSSACPCSTELSLYAARTRGVYAIPHSQRSVARVGIEFEDMIWIEDVIDICKKQLQTETLVFCKRQDEQAFAELNGANIKFVEDAVRSLYHGFDEFKKVKDFKIVVSHMESLHDHNAIAVITKGVKGSIFNHHVPLEVLKDMSQEHC